MYIPGNDQVTTWTTWSQQYDYDELNRLKRVHEYTGNPALDWQQEFNYDRWGNRTIHQTNTWGTNIPKPNFGIDVANNNRLTAPAGYSMSYDNAGNVTSDTYSGGSSRTYDAENKMTASQDTLGVWSYYTYNADGQRVRRKINNVETWQIYGIDGELLAEYPVNGAVASPKKEYGYRNGQLLVTAEPAVGGAQNVSWTNAVGVSVSGNNLTKTASNDWYNARASSTQSINSGNGYVEFTASETTTNRMLGLGEFATGYYTYSNIRYAIYLAGSVLYTEEYGSLTNVGSYASGDTLRVAIENGAVKYYKNGALLRTSTLAPTYPLYVNVAMYSSGSTLNGAVIDNGSGGGSSAQIRWLVPDHLGTPRIVFDATGNLANVSRHDYLPFGEELLAGQGLRSTSLGYSGNDGVRQQFTQKERDVETGLDYFGARYYASGQGRFTSTDPMPIKKRHLVDPRDLNRYAYVANNPLKYIDAEGLEKIVVIVRTFIPAEKVTHPPGVGATFKGDYNSKGERISARTEHRMVVETDAKKPNSNSFLENVPKVGPTEKLARGVGSLTGAYHGQASGESMQAGLVRINDNTVRLDVKGDEANPLVTGSPGITYRFNITVSSEGETGRTSVGVLGQHDGFPAYEVEVIRPDSGGTSTKVYQHDPTKTGDGPQSLYGSGEYYPDVKTVIEPKKKP